MNSIYIKFSKIVKHHKRHSSFIILNCLILLFLSIIILTHSIYSKIIDDYINSESNREIIITSIKNIDTFKNIISEQEKEIEIINYNVEYTDSKYGINIITDSEDFCYSKKTIKVNSNFKINTLITFETEIIYDEELPNDVVLLNQKISQELIYQKKIPEYTITLKIHNYTTVDKILDLLEKNEIFAYKNESTTDTVMPYIKLNKILNSFFIIFFILGIVLIVYILLENINNQKSNIFLISSIGYSYTQIIKIYLYSILRWILFKFVFIIFIFAIITNESIRISTVEKIFKTAIIILTINILLTVVNIKIFIRQK